MYWYFWKKQVGSGSLSCSWVSLECERPLGHSGRGRGLVASVCRGAAVGLCLDCLGEVLQPLVR